MDPGNAGTLPVYTLDAYKSVLSLYFASSLYWYEMEIEWKLDFKLRSQLWDRFP